MWLPARDAGLVLLALLLPVAVARAQDAPRVAIVRSDAELSGALSEALAAWNVSVVTLERAGSDAPGATMPESGRQGLELARRAGAEAVVWTSQSASGWAIWVYDVESGRAMTRPLPGAPPFDEATAAAVALSVMAMLRHSAAAPPEQRVRPPIAEPAAQTVEPTPRADSESLAELARREARVEIAAGAEGWATSGDALEARVAFGVGYWPGVWAGVGGLSLAARFGSGYGVDAEGLTARLFDARVTVRGHLRGMVAGPLAFGALLGVGVRVAVLEGSHSSGRQIDEVRPAGVLELAGEVAIDVDPLLVALRIGATATPWLQRYEVVGVTVLESRALWPFAELAVEVGFR